MSKLRTLGLALILFAGAARAASAENYTCSLQPQQVVPPAASSASGYARISINPATGALSFTVVFNGLTSNQTAAHVHGPAAIGASIGVAINFGAVGGTSGTLSGNTTVTPTQVAQFRAHLMYVDVHSVNFSGSEIRGQCGIGRPLDFDGDGRTDYSVIRFPNVAPPGVAPITFYNLQSTAGFAGAQWGDANRDFPQPGDYDGDGREDVAVYRAGETAGAPSYFYISQSSNGAFRAVQWGLNGDEAVCRDYDGDGLTDIAVFRPGASAGLPAYWYILQSSNGALRVVQWGTTGNGTTSLDVPSPADYDGDGKADIAVYRFGMAPANTFLIQRSSDGGAVFQPWGNFNTDYIVPGDFDGDGKFDIAVARTGATGTSPLVWYVLQSSNGQLFVVSFGLSNDRAVPGDYDGDAKTDVAIYRAGATAGAQSVFWVRNSFTLAVSATPWGLGADYPVAFFDIH